MQEQFKQFHKSSRYDWFVSNWGTVKRVANGNINRGKTKIVKTYSTGGHKKQYQAISINGAPEKYVHRLVGMMFIDNPKGLPTINHKDGDKANNHVSNLEWSTHSDNIKHSYSLLGRAPATAPKRSLRNITFQDAEDIRKQYANGSWSLNKLGKEYGLFASSIKQIIENKTYREI